MHTAYFFEVVLPGQAGSLWEEAWPTAAQAQQARAATKDQAWHDVLAQQQAIYEELLASPEWAGAGERSSTSQRRLSARELTRDLTGWSLPQAAALPTSNSLIA